MLSPMWHYMEEAATWYSDYVPASPALDTSIFQQDGWDWASVVVLTCESSCHAGEESWCVAPEEVVAFNLSHEHSRASAASAALNGAHMDGKSIEYAQAGIQSDREE